MFGARQTNDRISEKVMSLINKLNLWHKITQISYLGLIFFVLFWTLLISPTEIVNPYIFAIVLLLPLLFAAKGVFKKQLYTYAWLQFINMIYFSHAIMIVMSDQANRSIGWIELSLVSINFTAAIISIRLN